MEPGYRNVRHSRISNDPVRSEPCLATSYLSTLEGLLCGSLSPRALCIETVSPLGQ